METIDFIAGIAMGIFFYHVFLNKLMNNPKLRKWVKKDENKIE